MAAEPVCVRTTGPTAQLSTTWRASTSFRLKTRRPVSSPIRACQSLNDKGKFYKELGLFSLRKKIEDSVNHAEMLALTALEVEEASHIKQEEMMHEHDLWDDLAKSNEILAKLADGAKVVADLKDLKYKAEEAKLITELADKEVINYGLFKQAYTASVDVRKFLDKYEMSKLLKGPYDAEGACVIIQAGSEGICSEIWAEQLIKMYTKWGQKHGYRGRIVEKCTSENGGFESVTIEFESKYAYGYLSGEIGIHRLIRNTHDQSMSPEASLAAVDVIPLFLDKAPELFIDDMDLAMSFFSSSEGKQRRNESSVHVHHIPTGLKLQSSGERSRFANKIKALNRLKAKLLVILKEQGISNIASINKVVNMWHQETRKYLFHPNKLVQDVKTGIQLPNLNSVLDGNIEPFISAHINIRQTCDLG